MILTAHQILFGLSNKKIIRLAGYVSRTGESRGVYRLLVGKPDGKIPLGRFSHRWEDNIKMGLQEAGWGHGLCWCGSEQGQMAGSCECGNEP